MRKGLRSRRASGRSEVLVESSAHANTRFVNVAVAQFDAIRSWSRRWVNVRVAHHGDRLDTFVPDSHVIIGGGSERSERAILHEPVQ